MHRFFVENEPVVQAVIPLPDNIAHQIARVLRLKPGEEIVLLDNHGFEYPAVLQQVDHQGCSILVIDKHLSESEPQTRLTLILGLTQREKLELILQKCTELGVSAILPVVTCRTLIQKPQDVEDKLLRWRKILTEAAEQSHRGRIPSLLPAMKYSDALAVAQPADALKLVLWEDESQTTLKTLLHGFKGREVVIIVGPEGGFSAEEVELARRNGYRSASLGKRILRMETAAMLASGLVIYELG